jgi:hypothetical protein
LSETRVLDLVAAFASPGPMVQRCNLRKEMKGNNKLMISRSRLSLLLLVVGLGACATTVVPQQNLEGAVAAIRAAEEVGADKVPAAALRLQLAKEQLERAKSMASENEQPAAQRLMLRSQADAELALALARNTAARSAATQATEKTKNLQSAAK